MKVTTANTAQTTVRMPPKILLALRMALLKEGKSLTAFFLECAEKRVKEKR